MYSVCKKTASVLTLFTVIVVAPVFSQEKSNLLGQLNTITTAVPFLIISPDARAGGMGDAGIATEPDAHCIHWNPSKMAFYPGRGIGSVSYTPWLRTLVNDIYLAYATGYYKPTASQAIGGSIRYFSLGQIDFTDQNGGSLGSFNPSEFALDVAYARKLGEEFSGGIALRFIHSNLTGGIPVPGGISSKAGNSVAADISVYYQKDVEVGKKDAVFAWGIAITNIGSKISYTETGDKDFIPINLRLGPALKLKLNDYNELAFNLDFNKLLVPTPPIYTSDSLGNELILFGKDPKVGVAAGMFQSFTDAPDGFREEMKEINIAGGVEYWYDKQFAFRTGYFFESAQKGNRKYFTLGAGLRYSVFGLDFSYLIPTEQRHPLENTLRFSLSFKFGDSTSARQPETTE
jgi:hypothetical protein